MGRGDETGKVEELQLLENHLQGFLAQRQAIQIELNEIDNALEEIGKSGDEVYKMTSGFLIKADKETARKELDEKMKMLKMREDSMEKQEKLIEKDVEKLREEVGKVVGKQ
jgi:prefoldin beta subunit